VQRAERPHALVDDVRDLAPTREPPEALRGRPDGDYLTVSFAGGRTGVLDLSVHRSRVWADVLRSLRETGQPAYVEIDPETGLITELLLPLRKTVGEIQETEEGLIVELIISHGAHYLRRSNPEFEELRKLLEAARKRGTLVLVTETLEEHEIIDVRPLDEPAGVGQ
jgi:hypothetical protein